MKGLFLDRDGILNQVVMRDGTPGSPRETGELKIIPEAVKLVAFAKTLDYCTVLITNQPDVAREKMSLSQLEKIHKKLLKSFPLDHIEVCTSADDTDPRRKPNPGMIVQSAKKLHIRLSSSFFLGDSAKDIEAGRRAGVRTILLQREYNKSCHGTADFNCGCFEEIQSILKAE